MTSQTTTEQAFAFFLRVGTIVNLHPSSDLWMQGAKTAEVRALVRAPDGAVQAIKVRPLGMGVPQKGKLRTILPQHILIKGCND